MIRYFHTDFIHHTQINFHENYATLRLRFPGTLKRHREERFPDFADSDFLSQDRGIHVFSAA